MSTKRIKRGGGRGFTLVEIIIAVALLGLAGAIILQLFIVSAAHNERSSRIDSALMHSQQLLEEFKQIKSPDEMLLNGSNWMPSTASDDESYVEMCFYDGNWRPCIESNALYRVDMTLSHENAQDDLAMPLTIGGEKYSYTALYKLQVKVTLLSSKEEKVVELSAHNLLTYISDASRREIA